MCSTCKRARANRLSSIAIAPMLLLGGPITQPLTQLLSSEAPGFTKIFDDSALAAEAVGTESDGKARFTCPMHPHYIAEDMGTCPICGMDLVKMQAGPDNLAAGESDKRTIVTVSAETMQNMGVRLGKAEATSFGRAIRSYGIVHANERLQSEITSRAEGWVEELKITAVGDQVKAGDPLFKLYSPKIIISQSDYLSARRSPSRQTTGLAQLRSFGVQDQALDLLRKRGKPLEKVPFFAQSSGTVAELMLKEGSYVKRGMMLAKIQDYSTVWLKVSVAEKDLSFIRSNTKAKVAFPNLPDRTADARVDYVYPTIDPKTRTGQVRLVIDNKDGQIRPGSYADVTFEVAATKRIAVPSEAVLMSGQGQYVVVSLGEGRFEPRLVKTGLTSNRRTEITAGVSANEDVVVSGQFMLDSESALREAFRKLERLQLPLSLLKPTKTEFALFDHLVDAALYLHEALVDGYDVEPRPLEPAVAIKDLMWPRYSNTKLAFVLEQSKAAVQQAQQAKTETEVQTALAALVEALRPWLVKGAPEHYASKKVQLYKDVASSRMWAQLKGKPINPYGRGKSEELPLGDTGQPKEARPKLANDVPGSKKGKMRGSHGG